MDISKNTRYTIPGRYDKGNYGEFCNVVGDNEAITVYVQTNKDLDHPNWVKISDVLDKTFSCYAQSQKFIDACLALVDSSDNKHEKIEELVDVLLSK